MLVLGDKPTNGRLEAMLEKLNERLVEQVNAKLDLFYVEWADWQTQYNLQLLSGDDNVDLITTATDWLFAWENAEKGAFLPLSEEMLKEHAPKTWAQVDGRRSLGPHEARRRADLLHPRGQLHPVHQPRLLLPRRLGHGGGLRERRDHEVRGLHEVLPVGQGQQARRVPVGRRGRRLRRPHRLHPGPHRLPDDPAGQRRQLLPVPDDRGRPEHRDLVVHGGRRAASRPPSSPRSGTRSASGVRTRRTTTATRVSSCTPASPEPTSTTRRPSSAQIYDNLYEEAAGLRPEVLLLGPGERQRLQGHPDARRHGGERLLGEPREGTRGLRHAPQR